MGSPVSSFSAWTSVLAAVDAGVDAVDLAMDSLSGFTSQPCLGSVVEALRGQPRDTGLDPARIRDISDYWEVVRAQYAAFETDMRAPASEVYLHEMPGGQFTNLREQARALGLAERWHEVAEAYAEVNRMFGDIVKVTPTSKVVGDMALVMVSGGLTRADVENLDREIAFPESVVGLFRGELGQMPGGFPEPLASKILKGEPAIEGRPGAVLPPADLEVARTQAEAETGWSLSPGDVYSWLFYPKVFADYAARHDLYGPVSALPTDVFFYGLPPGREVSFELERGLTLVVRCLAIGKIDEDGYLSITDRKKDLFKTSGGKYVAPQPIENQIKTSSYVSIAVVVAEGRNFPSALIVPDFEKLQQYAEQQGIDVANRGTLVRNARIVSMIENEVDSACQGLARHERVKKVALLEEEFSIDKGEITPTMKVRRGEVEKRYADRIEEIYSS
jgi:hypothetical protein